MQRRAALTASAGVGAELEGRSHDRWAMRPAESSARVKGPGWGHSPSRQVKVRGQPAARLRARPDPVCWAAAVVAAALALLLDACCGAHATRSEIKALSDARMAWSVVPGLSAASRAHAARTPALLKAPSYRQRGGSRAGCGAGGSGRGRACLSAGALPVPLPWKPRLTPLARAAETLADAAADGRHTALDAQGPVCMCRHSSAGGAEAAAVVGAGTPSSPGSGVSARAPPACPVRAVRAPARDLAGGGDGRGVGARVAVTTVTEDASRRQMRPKGVACVWPTTMEGAEAGCVCDRGVSIRSSDKGGAPSLTGMGMEGGAGVAREASTRSGRRPRMAGRWVVLYQHKNMACQPRPSSSRMAALLQQRKNITCQPRPSGPGRIGPAPLLYLRGGAGSGVWRECSPSCGGGSGYRVAVDGAGGAEGGGEGGVEGDARGRTRDTGNDDQLHDTHSAGGDGGGLLPGPWDARFPPKSDDGDGLFPGAWDGWQYMEDEPRCDLNVAA